MQNAIVFFVVSFFSLTLLFAKKTAIHDTDIRHNMPVRGALHPYAVSRKNAKRFEKKFRGRFRKKPRFSALTRKHKIYLLTKKEAQSRALKKFYIKSTGKEPPYAFYDTTYRQRLKRGLKSLEDLLTGYKDARLNDKLLYAIADEYPEIARLYEIGRTRLGREILAVRLGSFSFNSRIADDAKKIPMLFNCSIHGDEMTSAEHCYRILYSILKNQKKYQDVLQHIDLWIVPLVNPDGAHLFWHQSYAMGRKNGRLLDGQTKTTLGRGVDLNRNFPFLWESGQTKASTDKPDAWNYRGDTPASEPETQALIDLFEERRFVYSISFHSAATKLLIPYTIEHVQNPEPDYASVFGHEISKTVVSHNPKKKFIATKNLYPVDGTDQDFFYFKYGTLAYILETSYHNCDYRYVQYYLEGYDALWEQFLRDYANNYKFALRVVDETGNPIEAEIQFSDLIWHNKEKHTTNPENGTFFRMTKSIESIQVKITADGFKTTTLAIEPLGEGYPSPQKIILPRVDSLLMEK